MKNKSKRNEYKDRAMFENDIALMVSNAERFNGPLNQISEIARELQSRAQALLDKRAGDIETMECVIKMDVAGFWSSMRMWWLCEIKCNQETILKRVKKE